MAGNMSRAVEQRSWRRGLLYVFPKFPLCGLDIHTALETQESRRSGMEKSEVSRNFGSSSSWLKWTSTLKMACWGFEQLIYLVPFRSSADRALHMFYDRTHIMLAQRSGQTSAINDPT